jgi:hypothetical protein
MAKLNSFTDFEAFQASRAFVREVGLLIRSPEVPAEADTATRLVGSLIRYLSGTELRGPKFGQRPQKKSPRRLPRNR